MLVCVPTGTFSTSTHKPHTTTSRTVNTHRHAPSPRTHAPSTHNTHTHITQHHVVDAAVADAHTPQGHKASSLATEGPKLQTLTWTCYTGHFVLDTGTYHHIRASLSHTKNGVFLDTEHKHVTCVDCVVYGDDCHLIVEQLLSNRTQAVTCDEEYAFA